MLVRGVIDDELGDYPEIAPVRLADERLEIGHLPIGRIDVPIVGNIVPVVAQRRWIERQEPQCRNAKILQIVELVAQALEIADAVIVGVKESLDVQLVDDRVLVPQGIGNRAARNRAAIDQRSGGVVGWCHGAVSSLKINAGLTSGSSWKR